MIFGKLSYLPEKMFSGWFGRPENKGFIVMSAPFEAGHQFVALRNQGVTDAAWSTDADILGIGFFRVYKSTTADGKVKVMMLKKLINLTLPKHVELPQVKISMSDLQIYCCMLGNDYICKRKKGNGVVACKNNMREYLARETEGGKQTFIKQYQQAHDDPSQCVKAHIAWHHACVYIIACPVSHRFCQRMLSN